MARIRCDRLEEGLRSSEVVAVFRDYRGREHYLRVEGDFLSREGDSYLLPVGVIQADVSHHAVLVELPHEAETGANRIWVNQNQFDESIEAIA